DMVKERFNEKDVQNGFILDGYPRNPLQAQFLDTLLKEHGMSLDIIINITSDDDIIIKRITGRRSCPICGAIYHIENNPPKVFGICDKDQTPLVQRKDDTEETVVKRLKVYYEETFPLIEYYKNKGLLVDIDGNGEILEITEKILEILGA